MEKQESGYVFLESDKDGFLHGEIRIEAAKLLQKQNLAKQLVTVGGPTADGASKARLMADLLGAGAIPLETQPNTGGNIDLIASFLADHSQGRRAVGVLTSFYHMPRTMRLAAKAGLHLTPICAEAVLMAYDGINWREKFKRYYASDSMLTRFLAEIQGLGDFEKETYRSR